MVTTLQPQTPGWCSWEFPTDSKMSRALLTTTLTRTTPNLQKQLSSEFQQLVGHICWTAQAMKQEFPLQGASTLHPTLLLCFPMNWSQDSPTGAKEYQSLLNKRLVARMRAREVVWKSLRKFLPPSLPWRTAREKQRWQVSEGTKLTSSCSSGDRNDLHFGRLCHFAP